MFKSVLVAVDGLTHAKAAVECGGKLAAKLGARVELRMSGRERSSAAPASPTVKIGADAMAFTAFSRDLNRQFDGRP